MASYAVPLRRHIHDLNAAQARRKVCPAGVVTSTRLREDLGANGKYVARPPGHKLRKSIFHYEHVAVQGVNTVVATFR
ncbi:MAG: hypothetical protein M3Y27_22625 [Acidobacteriota bacterium]|nr:hypothetical protein [Acidobacteriota bacterium]